MADLIWSDDFQTGGEMHAVQKATDGLRLGVKPALEFHGASYYGDRVRIPASASLDVAGPMTLLVRVSVNNPSIGRPWMQFGDAVLGVHFWNWQADTTDGGPYPWANYVDVGGTSYYLQGPNALAAATWYDMATHYDGYAGRIYRDGVHQVGAAFGVFTPRTGGPLFLGYRHSAIASYRSLDGKISWAALFSGALSEEQISNLRYRVPKPDEPGLRGYWFLDEGSGTQAKDLSVNGNHGALEGPSATQLPAWVPGEKRMGVRFLTLALSAVGVAQYSKIEWASNEPAGTGVTIETNLSLDGGVTWQGWQVCTNGGTIPGIAPGTDLSNAFLKIWEHLHTKDPAVEPVLHRLTISINSAVLAGLPRRVIPVFRSGRLHPVPHRGRAYPLP